MIEDLLSKWFPPRLPGRIERAGEPMTRITFDEQGSAGPARPKKYRDGIERHFAETAAELAERAEYTQPLWVANLLSR